MRWQTLYESRWILAILAVAAVICFLIAPLLVLFPAAAILFTLYFFRDPQREIPDGEGLIVSPADGRVSDIGEIEETEFGNGRCIRVGIFLSVFDVHVNRMPAAGRVVATTEHSGAYHDARNPLASAKNAARSWAFDCGGTPLVVRQITGAIARRIVPWAAAGDELPRGAHFGMIRFGSRTEIYLPLDASIEVRVGQHVQGASTVLARLPSASA